MVALFVVLTIVALITVGSVLQWNQTKEKRAIQPFAPEPTGASLPALALEGVSIPEGIFVDRGHTWVELAHSGMTHIGVDDFVQKAIGRIDEVELPQVGQEVRRGETLFAIRQGERKAVFLAPIDGVVSSVNDSLAKHPEAVKANPYEQGWICGLSPKNLARNINRLFVGEEAVAWIDKEVERFQEFFASRPTESMALGHVLADGGQLTEGVLELMDDESWHIFTNIFLREPVVERES